MCLILFAGCAEEASPDPSMDQWNALWQLNEEELRGELTFFDNSYARLEVDGEPQSLLINEPASINFFWISKGDELTLRRLDNDIELKYRIVKQSPDYMELVFAEDIRLKLYRDQ